MYTQSRLLYRMLVVMLATIAFACGRESQEASVPADLAKIDNLTTFSGDASPNVEINFEHELSLGDSPEQPIGGMGGFDVDDGGRIYVNDLQKNTLYIFEPDGDYLTSVGESGRGPGEYMLGPLPRVKSDQLLLLDMMNSRVTQYSLADLELVRTIKINPMNKGSFKELSDAMLNKIMIINEETFLVRLSTHISRVPEDAGEIKDDKLIYFYLMGDDARLTGPLTEPVPRYELTGESTPLMAKYTGRFSRGEPKPQIFTKPVVAASDNGYIFTAMSDQLLIKKYTTDGDYLSAFYHPFEHVEMSREDANQLSEDALSYRFSQPK